MSVVESRSVASGSSASSSKSAEERRSVSAKQLRANRRNAQRSTGPCTEEGKARSARNALDHGIFCKDLLMPGEDPAEFEQFCALLLSDFSPRDFLERTIAQQYVEAKWRIRRVRRAEREAHDALAGNIEYHGGQAFLDLRRRLRDLPRLESLAPGDPDPRRGVHDPRAREDLREQRYADRRALVPVSATMAESFCTPGQGSFERLGRYERQLELSADRALRQLRQLRKERGDDWPAPEMAPTEEAADEEDAPTEDLAPTESLPDPCPQGSHHAPCTSTRASIAQNEQNEPILAETSAALDAAEGCERSQHETKASMTPVLMHPMRIDTRVAQEGRKDYTIGR